VSARTAYNRPIEDLLLIARCELQTNPTITVYTFDNGVEKRRLANPWAALRKSMEDFAEAASTAMERFGESFSKAAEAFRASEAARRGSDPNPAPNLSVGASGGLEEDNQQ
jgi:hypothetical protein